VEVISTVSLAMAYNLALALYYNFIELLKEGY
jgi:hypothetical protein